MKDLRGRNALVTGASGGLGTHIARRLAREGMNVAVSGRREDALTLIAKELSGLGVKSEAVPADLADLDQIGSLVGRSEDRLGPIDLLVNNAGIEITSSFTGYAVGELRTVVDVNLTAPLLLTRLLTPGMLERGRGHVVFISSAAGKVGTAYQEPYSATKAGLVALTQSLRAEYLASEVGFSVVCPGFIAGDGMYQRMLESGFKSNRLMGETTVAKVTDKVIAAIVRDLPEVIETGAPIRPALALGQLAPRAVERIAPKFGVTELFGRVAAERGRDV
jgi:short-subunit dehydrogenase